MKERFRAVRITDAGSFEGEELHEAGSPISFSASFPLFLIREAWKRGCDMEDLADGYAGFAVHIDLAEGTHDVVSGAMGTNGDWSAIRDSTDEAQARMFERALNFFFGEERRPS